MVKNGPIDDISSEDRWTDTVDQEMSPKSRSTPMQGIQFKGFRICQINAPQIYYCSCL